MFEKTHIDNFGTRMVLGPAMARSADGQGRICLGMPYAGKEVIVLVYQPKFADYAHFFRRQSPEEVAPWLPILQDVQVNLVAKWESDEYMRQIKAEYGLDEEDMTDLDRIVRYINDDIENDLSWIAEKLEGSLSLEYLRVAIWGEIDDWGSKPKDVQDKFNNVIDAALATLRSAINEAFQK
jgi:hypothetical protein